jgi:hypothetical protein
MRKFKNLSQFSNKLKAKFVGISSTYLKNIREFKAPLIKPNLKNSIGNYKIYQ